ncbi:transcription factor HES-1-like [Paramacrobiotus metropolitanus]|uniref:transcription factor HES-1-like n=1 Tax=Paramacrobiotus metropolitanus TaxID=2943436 RepID=UPI0024460DF6|nr:transcription factor HES-1-like [Paramacrobiotus metropolitanus]
MMTSDSTGTMSKRVAQSATNRKISKGVIERKRRARINQSLAELKFIILSESKDRGLHSKLDKAEILERTLAFVQTLQNRQNHRPDDCAIHSSAYRDGYFACMKDVDRFLSGEHFDEVVKQKISNHLTFCCHAAERMLQFPNQDNSSNLTFANSYSVLPAYHSLTRSPASFLHSGCAVVPQSPSPSLTVSSCYSSTGYPSSPIKTEAVWRPW